ncbi:Transcription initiation factor IIF subunit beta [Sparassis crispa]|uniref:Transcription initiation factor IIF subunit beta n=1 Tax=Sparassis crispa TaxID=139825 RepID=A0A401H0X4_9APHY|nr:Transcription initiation factor IIF subunit beta [Sparassis crispa]GBE88039.1 Transcription initiation factor IIF subunit beta [Sparassis crispa]
MEGPPAEELRQFEAVNSARHGYFQEEPDETLDCCGAGDVWMVKIPKYLLEHWSTIDQEDVELATIRVYTEAKSSRGRPLAMLSVSPTEDNPACDEFELEMTTLAVQNQIVIAELEKDTRSPARITKLIGAVKRECSLRPVLSDKYRQRLKQRIRAANARSRQIKLLEDVHPGGRGAVNMLASGAAHQAPFNFVPPKPKPAKGQFERMTRMPRNQLLDELFDAFSEREHWSMKWLRERTQQPETYLREVLSEIAFIHRSGEHNGSWELLQNFKGEGTGSEGVPRPSYISAIGADIPAVEVEDCDEDDFDDFDEDEDDLEEIV